jgi:hypothetical protein
MLSYLKIAGILALFLLAALTAAAQTGPVRRKGNEWFAGSMTNQDARELDVPLSLLGSGAHDAEIYSDGPKAAGGSAIRLLPVR